MHFNRQPAALLVPAIGWLAFLTFLDDLGLISCTHSFLLNERIPFPKCHLFDARVHCVIYKSRSGRLVIQCKAISKPFCKTVVSFPSTTPSSETPETPPHAMKKRSRTMHCYESHHVIAFLLSSIPSSPSNISPLRT